MIYPDGVADQRRGKGRYLFPFISFDRRTNHFSETALAISRLKSPMWPLAEFADGV